MPQSPRLSAPVEHALAAGGSTGRLFGALAAADVKADWSRIELLTLAQERVERSTSVDADTTPAAWHAYRLTGTAARAVRVAEGIAADYGLIPMPPAVLVLGLIAAPGTAVSAALRLGREGDRDRFSALVQEELLDAELEGLDLTARWADAAGEQGSTRPSASAAVPPPPPPAPSGRAEPKVGHPARWLLAVAALLFVLASVVTAAMAPARDRPGPSPDRLLLAEDAVGAGFAPRPGWSRTPVPDDPSARRRCEVATGRWTRGSARLLVEVRRCVSFTNAAARQDAAERRLRADAASTGWAAGMPHTLVAHGVQPDSAPYTAVLFRRGQYIAHVRIATPGSPPTSDQERFLTDVARRQGLALPGTPGGPISAVDPTRLTSRVGIFVLASVLAVAVVANLTAGAGVRRLTATTRWPLDSPGLTWHDVTSPARTMGYQAQSRFWLFSVLWGVALLAPLPWFVRLAGFVVCTNQLVLSRFFQPGRHRLWGRHAAPQVRLRVQGAGPRIRALAVAGSSLQVAALAPLSMIVIIVLLAPHGNLRLLGRYAPAVVADARLSLPFRLLPIPLILVGLALTVVTLWRAGSSYFSTALRRAGADTGRVRAADPRPPVLVLGTGNEAPIRTSPPTRRSFLEKVGAGQHEPFGAVLVRFLSPYGPVLTVRRPGRSTVAGGPAPVTVADDRWTDEVWSLIQESALLVIQVAPAPPDDDLIWALAAIVEAGALDRTIFLLGPAPAEETTEAWRRFRAVSRLAPPDGLDEHADRLLTARADLIGDWTAVHAGRRTDWAYGFALTHLADTVTAERPGTPVA